MDLEAKAFADLQWDSLRQAVRERRQAGVDADEPLPLCGSAEGVRVALDETEEALSCLVQGEPLPLDGVRAIRQHLLRVERDGDLDLIAMGDVRSSLRAARVLRRFLNARKADLPALHGACVLDAALDGLLEQLDACIDTDGNLADHASVDLKRLRTETRNLRGRLVSRLEGLVLKHAELLSDRFYTQREGRYVLPVRADTHERVHGIVHGSSSSGATIYVEPRALIEAGNRLKLALAEQEREEARILAELSQHLRERVPSVRAAYDSLLHADLRAACARLAREMKAVRPELSDPPRIELKQARHPVLLLDGTDVVPNDVEAAPGGALVISGPNAGGKTVALKMLGLSALMVRAGLFLPADPGSVCGFFDAVLSDVGDEQSLTRNLSTFSAHVDNLRRILARAGEGSLVLLDELAGSTDPTEGAALACAVVEALCERGAAAAVTTHYEQLKAAALNDDRMRNASVGFDVARMEPTFKLRLDVPGASSALSVAERFGMPAGVIERARQVLPEQSKSFDALVQRLQSQWDSLAGERQALASELAAAERARADVEAELQKQKARDKKQLQGEAQRVMDGLREARAQLDATKKRLKAERVTSEQLQAERRVVEEAARKAADMAPVDEKVADERADAPLPDAQSLSVGDRVYVPHLRSEAEIVEPPNRGKVRVAAGPLRLWVNVDQLRGSSQEPVPATAAAAPPSTPAPAKRASTKTPDNTLDLRGMRVDDALDMLESFLDRMFGRNESAAYVYHGVGTGALRDAVRSFLARPSPYVEGFRPAEREEGGERLTVVQLR